MKIDFSKTLNKEFVLSRVGEEEIFERYGRGLRVQEGSFRSSFRTDRHPTCNFLKRRDGRLILKDHAGHFKGDCFDMVMMLEGLSFGQTIKRIANDFGLLDEIVNYERKPVISLVQISSEPSKLLVKRRDWNSHDARFWGRWEIKSSSLEFYHVSAVERVWLDDEAVYAYISPGKEAYVYYFGEYDYKVYFPYKDKVRFLHNNSHVLQGYLQLPDNGTFIVITKSLKDVIKLYEYGIPAVAPMSETTIPSIAQMEELAERFGRIILFYDNDLAGKKSMIRLAKQYGEKFSLEFLLMPVGYPKDFTDYFEKKGRASTQDLIDHVKTELNL